MFNISFVSVIVVRNLHFEGTVFKDVELVCGIEVEENLVSKLVFTVGGSCSQLYR